MPATISAAPDVPAHGRWGTRRVLSAALAIALAVMGFMCYKVVIGSNSHTVIPGRAYRCAQPTAAALEQMITREGIKTVVNLRGPCDPFDWYLAEARTAHDHNVSLEDISFSAGRMPPVSEIRELVEVLERTEYPIALHCRRGSDRTGLACAVLMLLTTDTPLAEARSQLSWRFGHLAFGRPALLDRFLDYYEQWLAHEGKPHSQDTFHHWAMNCYCPGDCRCELAFSEAPSVVTSVEPAVYHVRARNTSMLPWTLRPQLTAGVHLGCMVYDEQDRQIDQVKTGLRDGTVQPGESMDFIVVIPPRHRPGRYRLTFDMVDEQQCWFYQAGSQPLETELIVRD